MAWTPYDDDDEPPEARDDPDVLLLRIRRLVNRWVINGGLTRGEVTIMATTFDMLDDHLSQGGDWPLPWRYGRPALAPPRRVIEDLPPL